MAEFDYKQRPFSKQLTDEDYDRAVGRVPDDHVDTCLVCGAEIPPGPDVCGSGCEALQIAYNESLLSLGRGPRGE